jgi:hypothetical protein
MKYKLMKMDEQEKWYISPVDDGKEGVADICELSVILGQRSAIWKRKERKRKILKVSEKIVSSQYWKK